MSRKKATDFFISTITKLDPNSGNVQLYKDYFKGMSDKAFGELMGKLERGEEILPYYEPILVKKPIPLDRVLKIGESIGVKYFEQLWITDPISGVEFLTPHKYLVLRLGIRRQNQHLVKKKSVATDSRKTDATTGQASGDSKAAGITQPELFVLDSNGFTAGATEMIKVRGGDTEAHRASRRAVIEQGGFSLNVLGKLGTQPTSTETLSSFLFAMHLDNNLKG